MRNKNAFAAFIAAQVVWGIQWMLSHQHYVHYVLSPHRQALVVGATITLVLLIGRDGVRGAIGRGVSFTKKLWTGWDTPDVAPQADGIIIDQAKAVEMARRNS